MEQDSRMRRDTQSFTITGGTSSQNGVMAYPRYSILEMHLGKFPDSMEFQSRKANFKTEVCASSQFPHITMHWIREVEMAKSMDDLMTSRSITGRTDFTDYDLLDAKIASALKKLITNMHFRRRVCTEEPPAQNETRFLRGRQMAFMKNEHLRATIAYDAAQGLSYLFNVRLQNKTRISKQDGTKLYYQRVKYLQKWSWKVCTSQNYKILFNIRRHWLCMNKKLFETANSRPIPD